MKVFLSGIIATPYAREFLARCAGALRDHGFECYSPGEGGWRPAPADHAESTVERDVEALEEADALLAVVDGYSVDDAVAAHIGTFYALMKDNPSKRGILGILHDTRVARWDWAAGPRALNYYLLGCIEARGRVHRSFAEALADLLRLDGRAGEPLRLDGGVA